MTELMDQLEDINRHFDSTGLSLLSIAVAEEALEGVKVLLEAGAEPNQWDLSGKMTALHTVAQTSLHTCQLLELLVQHGGNINNGREKAGGSVLHHGVSQRNYPMVKYLLDHKVETVCRTFHETALHTAVELDDHTMAELLLEANRGCVNSLMNDTRRLSPLHLAAEAGHTETCKVLLRFGADVSLLTGNNMTALHLAARNLNLEVLKQLLEVSVRKDTNLINARDNQGRTALFVCSSSQLKSSQGAVDCMIALINLNADLDAQDDVGNTPLHNAAIGDPSISFDIDNLNETICNLRNYCLQFCRQEGESRQIIDQIRSRPEHQEQRRTFRSFLHQQTRPSVLQSLRGET